MHTEKGASLLLGCAHAGLTNILAYARKTFGIEEFDTVLGGTHLGGLPRRELPLWIEALRAFKVRRRRPCHCTGFAAAAAMARAFEDVDRAACGTRHEL